MANRRLELGVTPAKFTHGADIGLLLFHFSFFEPIFDRLPTKVFKNLKILVGVGSFKQSLDIGIRCG